MVKKILFVLLFSLLVVPVKCFAGSGYGVMIGGMFYERLEDAIKNASSGDVISLISDVELDDSLLIDKEINIDLNGNDISVPTVAFLVEGGALNISGAGVIRETSPNEGVIKIIGSSDDTSEKYSVVKVGKDVTLEGWSGIFISHNSTKSYGVYVDFDGKINAVSDTSGGSGIGIYVNGNITDKNNSPIVNVLDNAEIRSNGNGLYIAGYSVFNIKNAYIQGKESGIGIKAGILNIDGAEVVCDGEDDTPTDGFNNGIKASGTTIQIESNNGYVGDIELNILRGDFTSKNSNVIYEYIGRGDESLVKSISILDGTFVSEASKDVFLLSNSFKNKHNTFISGGKYSSDPKFYVMSGYTSSKDGDLYSVVKNMRTVFLESIDSNNNFWWKLLIGLIVLIGGVLVYVYRLKIVDASKKIMAWFVK